MIYCRVTEDIMTNAEIFPFSGENVERDGGGGAPLSLKKHRPFAKAVDFPSFSQHITQIAPDERERG